jgi:translation initiation factor 1
MAWGQLRLLALSPCDNPAPDITEQAMSRSTTVYSTEQGRLCPGCSQPVAKCQCKAAQKQQVKGDGKVRVSRETKGRKGKGVSLISGLPLNEEELKKLAASLKQQCGTGGTVRDGVIEIQGDHRDKLLKLLQDQGYNAKLAGG